MTIYHHHCNKSGGQCAQVRERRSAVNWY